jgi:hypothetical protein
MSKGSYALPAGVTARTVETPRLATYLLESGPEDFRRIVVGLLGEHGGGFAL